MIVDRVVYALVVRVPAFRGRTRPSIDEVTCLVAADWHEENGTNWEETGVGHWVREPDRVASPAAYLRGIS